MKLVTLFVGICLLFSVGCASSKAKVEPYEPAEPEVQPTPEPTIPPVPVELLALSSAQLCDRLADIKVIPTFKPTPTDPIYEALVAKGDDAIPCLVDKISDTTRVPDPRYSVPSWQHFAVGDTAVFLLTRILRDTDLERQDLLIQMLPKAFQEEWKTNGIYAYFNYVSEPRNRKQLQRWWTKWIKENKK